MSNTPRTSQRGVIPWTGIYPPPQDRKSSLHGGDLRLLSGDNLLSETAKADSDPVLEILTSDIIRCSHGATAGPVDEEQLYYLQTRGIPHPEAEALLVRAFLGQVLDRVPDEAVRDELAAILDGPSG